MRVAPLQVVQQRVGIGTRRLTGDATVADRSYPIATRLELLHRELPIRQLCVLDPHAWMIAPMWAAPALAAGQVRSTL
jgi:hypothetical protein